MKVKQRAFVFMVISTVLTAVNGIFFFVFPLPFSNFVVANAVYYFFTYGSSMYLLFFVISLIIFLFAILGLKKMHGFSNIWIVPVFITFILYWIDFLRNSYFVFLAIQEGRYSVPSVFIYGLVALTDLVITIMLLLTWKTSYHTASSFK